MKTKAALFTSPNVYRPTWPNRLFPLLITTGVVAFLWIVIFFETHSGPATAAAFFLIFTILSLALLLLSGLFCLWTMRVYILTAPEGLFYQSTGFCLYTPWNNVGDVRTVDYGMRSIENLSLKHEAITEMRLEDAIKERIAVLNTAAAMRAAEAAQPALNVVATASNIERGRYWTGRTGSSSASRSTLVPVGIFGAAWKTGALRDDINRYKTAEAHTQRREQVQREDL